MAVYSDVLESASALLSGVNCVVDKLNHSHPLDLSAEKVTAQHSVVVGEVGVCEVLLCFSQVSGHVSSIYGLDFDSTPVLVFSQFLRSIFTDKFCEDLLRSGVDFLEF